MGWSKKTHQASASEDDRWAVLPTEPVPGWLREEFEGDLPEHGLPRSVWTERDFPAMGWHDATLWGWKVEHFDIEDTDTEWADSVFLDLDYITRWVARGRSFDFWVAPCTLVFRGVTELEVAQELSPSTARSLSLADIHRVRGGWLVEGTGGFELKLAASGFTQTFRREPVLTSAQSLLLRRRGGHSFDQQPWDASAPA